jgi:hypothetical protein
MGKILAREFISLDGRPAKFELGQEEAYTNGVVRLSYTAAG